MIQTGQAISVIVPALNEVTGLLRTLACVSNALPSAEIIIVDGGSTDGTRELTLPTGARLISSPPGRGVQMAAGAAEAQRRLLLFLHADTLLPPESAVVLAQAFADPRIQVGTFRLGFDHGGWFLRTSAWFTRFDSVFTRFGDQAIVMRRDFYAQLGGFPPWPLFEDVELLRRARRFTRIVSLPASVTTSARRFERSGHLRQQCRNGWLLLRFLAGACPHQLAAEYATEPSAPTMP